MPRFVEVADLTALQALAIHRPGDIVIVGDVSSMAFWRWSPASSAAHDGVAVVKPSNVLATQLGRWVPAAVGVLAETIPLSALEDGSGVVSNPGLKAINVLHVPQDFVEGDLISIGADTYEIRSGGGAAPGNIEVEVAGQFSPGVVLPLLRVAINELGTEEVDCPIQVGANQLIIQALEPGVVALACTAVFDDVLNKWVSATMFGGAAPVLKKQSSVSRVPTAEEVVVGQLHFTFPFAVGKALAVVRVTATGVQIAFGGTLTIVNNGQQGRVTLTNGTDPDFAATDTVTVLAFE